MELLASESSTHSTWFLGSGEKLYIVVSLGELEFMNISGVEYSMLMSLSCCLVETYMRSLQRNLNLRRSSYS